MMRAKSPRSDVEMTKKKLSWRPSWIFGGHFSINFDQIWYTHIKFTSEQFLFFVQYSNVNILELFKKNSFLTFYIHISKGHNSLTNSLIHQIFFTGSEHYSNSVFFSCSLRSIQMSIFLEKKHFLPCIHISKGRNSLKNCAMDQIFFYRFRTFQLSFLLFTQYSNVNIF